MSIHGWTIFAIGFITGAIVILTLALSPNDYFGHRHVHYHANYQTELRIPKCQEDQIFLEAAGFFSNGHWSHYFCRHPDDLWENSHG